VDEFVNTWSIEGFREEGTTTAEMGWGTHEKSCQRWPTSTPTAEKPDLPGADGDQHLGRHLGADCPIHGMVVRHGEAFTISDRLTVWEEGQAIYRPTSTTPIALRRGDQRPGAAQPRLPAPADCGSSTTRSPAGRHPRRAVDGHPYQSCDGQPADD